MPRKLLCKVIDKKPVVSTIWRDLLCIVSEEDSRSVTDTETKRKAIEQAYPDLIDSQLPDWSQDQALLSWLSEL
jgi:hypothetical protein